MPKSYTRADLVEFLKFTAGNMGQKRLAASLGFSAQFINDVIKGRRDMTDQLARELGFYRVTLYMKTPKS